MFLYSIIYDNFVFRVKYNAWRNWSNKLQNISLNIYENMEAPIETHRSRMLFSLEKSLWNRYNQFALSIKSNKNDDRMHRAYRTFSAKVMGTGGGG